MRTSTIFRSRRMALLWAGGIIWTAVELAGSAPRDASPAEGAGNAATTDAAGAPVDPAQLNQAAAILEQFGR